jgi:hypothetical protein
MMSPPAAVTTVWIQLDETPGSATTRYSWDRASALAGWAAEATTASDASIATVAASATRCDLRNKCTPSLLIDALAASIAKVYQSTASHRLLRSMDRDFCMSGNHMTVHHVF